MKTLFGWFALSGLALASAMSTAQAADTKIVLIAGTPSHAAGAHEFNAGTKLLVKCLKEIPGIDPVLVQGGGRRMRASSKAPSRSSSSWMAAAGIR